MPGPPSSPRLLGGDGPLRVHLSSHLRSYTRERAAVEARGATVGAALKDLDRRYPGLRFRIIDEQDRIRPHVKLFVNDEPVHALAARVRPGDELHIIGALSGG